MTEQSQQSQQIQPSSQFLPCRRAVLTSSAGVALAGLAACGSGSSDTATTSPAAAASSAGSSAASSAASSPAAAAGAKPDGGVVELSTVPVGSSVTEGDYVISRPTSDTVKAFDRKCPHEGAAVNGGPIIICPRHQAEFKAADGSVIKGPATTGLTERTANVTNGWVVVA